MDEGAEIESVDCGVAGPVLAWHWAPAGLGGLGVLLSPEQTANTFEYPLNLCVVAGQFSRKRVFFFMHLGQKCWLCAAMRREKVDFHSSWLGDGDNQNRN